MQGKLGLGRNQPTLALMASIEETFQAAIPIIRLAARPPLLKAMAGWLANGG
jgi:hypothetical protein